MCFYYGYVTFFNPTEHNGNLPINTIEDIMEVKSVGKFIGIIGAVFYSIILISCLRRGISNLKDNDKNKNNLETLLEYGKSL